MADSNVNSLTSNPLDGGSSTGGNIIGSNSNTFDDGISYQGSSSSSDLRQSPFGRLSGVTDLNTIFNGVGSGGENPFANNPLGAQVLFGGDNQGGSPFANLRTNIENLVGSSTNGSNSTNPFVNGGISAQSADDGTTSFSGSNIPSFADGDTNITAFEMRVMIDNLVNSKLSENGINVGVGGAIPIEGGGIGTGLEGGNLSDPFAPGGSNPFGIPFDEILSEFGIPSDETLSEFGIPSDSSFSEG
ncbi:hypothetical protein [Tolypothrix sp. VBCCA 56010]|uniref:hypothetical protein n=1 Tax=Tolypothrix sp. VBCCA 56010 TaxID=3137731 RepID=UPI003D7EEFC8